MAENQVEVKLPNHMTVEELIASGKTPEQAKHIMAERVFGKDFKLDKDGVPIEQGIGSDANPFKSTHLAALAKAKAMKLTEGGAAPETIAAIVAAVMEAMETRQAKDL